MPSSVLDVEVAHLLDGTPCRVVREDWQDKDGEIITKGFVFDGASTPRFLWMLIPPFRDLELSCRHDWDCMHARIMMARSGIRNEEIAKALRKDADKRYGKRKRGVDNFVIGILAYAGVRLGAFFGIGWKIKKYILREE